MRKGCIESIEIRNDQREDKRDLKENDDKKEAMKLE